MIEFRVKNNKLPYTVVDLPSGTFAVVNTNWHPVPKGTKYSDIKVIEEEPLPKLISTRLSRLEFTHESSKGSQIYDVIRKTDGTWNCNCIGFGVHKKCKHVEHFKEKTV